MSQLTTTAAPMQLMERPTAEQAGKSIARFLKVPPEEGIAMAIVFERTGMDPLTYLRTYHTIQGKPTMRADAMLAQFNQRGYEHQIIETTPERAAFAYWPAGKPDLRQEVEFTWESAKQSRWPWKDANNHDKGLKDNWSTPEDRENMLWARLVSKTIRRVCPAVCSGLYTPEETIDATDYTVRSNVPASPSADELLGRTTGEKVTTAATILDAEPVAISHVPNEPSPEQMVEQETVVEKRDEPIEQASPVQQQRITELWTRLEVPMESRTKQLANRQAEYLHELHPDQAAELITRLEGAASQQGK